MTRSWNAIGRLEAVDGENTKQTQFLGKPIPFNNLPRRADLDFEIRRLCFCGAPSRECERAVAELSLVGGDESAPRKPPTYEKLPNKANL